MNTFYHLNLKHLASLCPHRLPEFYSFLNMLFFCKLYHCLIFIMIVDAELLSQPTYHWFTFYLISTLKGFLVVSKATIFSFLFYLKAISSFIPSCFWEKAFLQVFLVLLSSSRRNPLPLLKVNFDLKTSSSTFISYILIWCSLEVKNNDNFLIFVI